MVLEINPLFLLPACLHSGIMLNVRAGESESTVLPTIDYSLCVGCGACAQLYPQFFEIRDDKAWFINYERFDMTLSKAIVGCCPFRAISIE
jgi:ferredoxin